jgi:asparagine synthase (glutamine-hydrolysing)
VWQRLSRFSTREHLQGYFRNDQQSDAVNVVLEAEFRSFLPDQVLAFVDRLSMAHSLETRCPYLDRVFVQFAASIPGRWKIRDSQVKYILKKAALGYLPPLVVNRPKEGFILPLRKWLRSHLRSYLCDNLSGFSLSKLGLFNPAAVQRLLERFFAGEEQVGDKLLTLLSFVVWYRQYIGG